MSSEAPVNAGHNFSNTAEDYEEREQWLKAAEFHFKAAEQFEIALKDTTDPEASKTLRLLTSNHIRKANELNRKAQRLIKSAANQRIHQMVGNNVKQTGSGLCHALPEKVYNNGLLVSRLLASRVEFGEASHHRNSEIGESYALLSNDYHDDPFNKFFEVVEGLVDQLFNPAVAFTSAPLNENDNPIPVVYGPPPSVSEDTVTRHVEETIDSVTKPADMLDSYYMVGFDDTENKGNAMQLSSNKEKSLEQKKKQGYKQENEKLKAQVAKLQKRIKTLKHAAEEGNMLKSSVLQFRDDVHKQAKRIMQSHHESSMRSSAAALMGGGAPSNSIMNGSSRHPVLSGGGGHDLLSRLKELEAENKQLQTQHERQAILVNKYRERWEMLKENAKKRRSSTVSSPITEEAEIL